jgi:hypothetical protein
MYQAPGVPNSLSAAGQAKFKRLSAGTPEITEQLR